MPRVVSFIVLLAISLLAGALFFKVMAQFVLPLFVAALLVVIFNPVHEALKKRWPRWPQLVGLATTLIIVLAVVLPLTWLGLNAYYETRRVVNFVTDHGDEFANQFQNQLSAVANGEPEQSGAEEQKTQQGAGAETTPDDQREEVASEESASGEQPTAEEGAEEPPQPEPVTGFLARCLRWYEQHFGQPLPTDQYLKRSLDWMIKQGPQLLIDSLFAMLGLGLGVVIAVVAVYYFLVDGPAMIDALMQLSPLDNEHERQLLARFSDISRAVVLATFLSAVTQGLIAGVAYYFVLPSGWPVFLLTGLTMVFAVVPFVGVMAVWVPLSLGVALFGGSEMVDGQLVLAGNQWGALFLALFCAFVVGNADNVVKPLVLHGQSNLHPLLALLSVIGGVTAMGPIGILVGPMIVSFFQALLTMLNQELNIMGSAEAMDKLGEAAGKLDEAAAALTEQKPPEADKPEETGDGEQEAEKAEGDAEDEGEKPDG